MPYLIEEINDLNNVMLLLFKLIIIGPLIIDQYYLDWYIN
jgi:hypothetical protein